MNLLRPKDIAKWYDNASIKERDKFFQLLDKNMFATSFMEIGTIHDQAHTWVVHVN